MAGNANARPATPEERAHFIAMENDWLADISRSDGYALWLMLAKDFTHISWNGTAEDKDDAIKSFLSKAHRRERLEEMDVNIFNDTTAIVTGTKSMGDGDGDVSLRFTDIFVLRDGAWMAVSAQETLIQKP
ncbi:MAG TPA: nuclear transport factor 2 family protein [Rhizomicrobium sp.]|jgi:hypothetical protein|nr:nuclear transport factor 2 family protein [Rhizomicrobium sp.]